ncbi:MAG: NUDIX hydrolase [Ktedonobacteraceae bacterium]
MSNFESLPKKRMASAALFLNVRNNILIVKPVYREHWLLPGGIVEERESPQQACIREVKEELGLDISPGQLLCVDYKVQQGTREEGIEFVFFGGILHEETIRQIQVQAEELSEVRFARLEDAIEMLNPWSERRIPFALRAYKNGTTVYLELTFRLISLFACWMEMLN